MTPQPDLHDLRHDVQRPRLDDTRSDRFGSSYANVDDTLEGEGVFEDVLLAWGEDASRRGTLESPPVVVGRELLRQG